MPYLSSYKTGNSLSVCQWGDQPDELCYEKYPATIYYKTGDMQGLEKGVSLGSSGKQMLRIS